MLPNFTTLLDYEICMHLEESDCIFRNGPSWCKIRKNFQKGLSGPLSVKKFLPGSEEIVAEWLERINNISTSPNSSINCLPELSRLFLECIVE